LILQPLTDLNIEVPFADGSPLHPGSSSSNITTLVKHIQLGFKSGRLQITS